MSTNKVTLEQLAEKLNKTIWVKGDLKRIYLNDAGYNTKKMTTKAFIFEKEVEFLVSVRIDCPSQHENWIEAEEKKVRESILEDIKNCIERILDPSIEEKEAIEEAEMQAKWEKEAPERERIALEKAKDLEVKKIMAVKENANNIPVGAKKVRHKSFGIGDVESETFDKIIILFESVGRKELLKSFAKLEAVC